MNKEGSTEIVNFMIPGAGIFIPGHGHINYMVKMFFVVFFVCLGVFRPTREFYTNLETSSLPMKGCKF